MLTELWTEEWLGYRRSHGHSARSSQDCGSFLRVSKCPELTFSFVAFVRDAIPASSFSGAVITWETVSRSGTASTSSQLPRLRVSKRASQAGCCAYWSHGKRTCRYAHDDLIIAGRSLTSCFCIQRHAGFMLHTFITTRPFKLHFAVTEQYFLRPPGLLSVTFTDTRQSISGVDPPHHGKLAVIYPQIHDQRLSRVRSAVEPVCPHRLSLGGL